MSMTTMPTITNLIPVNTTSPIKETQTIEAEAMDKTITVKSIKTTGTTNTKVLEEESSSLSRLMIMEESMTMDLKKSLRTCQDTEELTVINSSRSIRSLLKRKSQLTINRPNKDPST